MILVTGSAGFIGFHVSRRLLEEGHDVHGLDNFNGYYDVGLKEARSRKLECNKRFTLHRMDLADAAPVENVFSKVKPSVVIHLAAQAGVRHSLTNPRAYAASNLTGFLNVLEGCRTEKVGHLVYASSSSVYGLNSTLPFSVHMATDHPVSFYAATKKANELMAHSYSHLYGIPTTGLRFFTVYGPWGRPDMAPILFAKAIAAGEPIKVFNHGEMWRDFTYVDDIVDGVLRALDRPASGTPPHAVYNLGNNKSEKLTDFIAQIEKALGNKAQMVMAPMQPGDVPATWADIDASTAALGYKPTTPISAGIPKFVDWFRDYYGA
jgi:UDP-glucuronate 4-epimerase